MNYGNILLYFFIFAFLFWVPIFAFAEGEGTGILAGLDELSDWITGMINANVEGSDLDEGQKDSIQNFVDSSGETGKGATSLWIKLHETIIDGISALAGGTFDKTVALLIAFVASTMIILFALYKLFRHSWKLAIILLAVFGIILVLPIWNLSL